MRIIALTEVRKNMSLIDVHTLKAMELYGVSKEEVTFEMRQIAKKHNYQYAYGILVPVIKDITPKD